MAADRVGEEKADPAGSVLTLFATGVEVGEKPVWGVDLTPPPGVLGGGVCGCDPAIWLGFLAGIAGVAAMTGAAAADGVAIRGAEGAGSAGWPARREGGGYPGGYPYG